MNQRLILVWLKTITTTFKLCIHDAICVGNVCSENVNCVLSDDYIIGSNDHSMFEEMGSI